MIVFAALVPHPPLLLPSVGSAEDRQKVKKTLKALELLARQFQKAKPETIVISSPHPDWGFEVPLYFLARDFAGEIQTFLTGFESPAEHFEKGKKFFEKLQEKKRYALLASGDLSHCLSPQSPYGFHPDGPSFDEALQKYLKAKDLENFLALDEQFPQASECGLRSFSFLLGVLTASGKLWRPQILSYEGPFGVGYLVAKLI
jgi:aromatic ring-opening dioxygenase LigB subunit